MDKPKTEREVFSLAYSRKRRTIRVTLRKRAVYIKLSRLLEAAVVILATIVIFAAARRYATVTRGYEAIGGEYLLLGLPALYCLLRVTVAALIRDFASHGAKPEEPSQSEPAQADVTLPQLSTAIYNLTRAWNAAGVSALDAAVNLAALGLEFQRVRGTNCPAYCVGINALITPRQKRRLIQKLDAAQAEAEQLRPLEIAFVGNTLASVNLMYREFAKDNGFYGTSPYRQGAPSTLPDGTRVVLLSWNTVSLIPHLAGRRFDQAIIVTDGRDGISPELAELMAYIKERDSGRVPEEFFFQFYNPDAEVPHE